MKHLYLNLKRFDVPVEYGGVNRIAPIRSWGEYIVKNTQDALAEYPAGQVEFVDFSRRRTCWAPSPRARLIAQWASAARVSTG